MCGIRPVKDPLFGIECWNHFKGLTESEIKLKIIGPIIDEEYGSRVLEAIKQSNQIEHVNYMEHDELLNEIASAYLTLNTSISEGQSAAVLESMSSGVPVLARDIPGRNLV